MLTQEEIKKILFQTAKIEKKEDGVCIITTFENQAKAIYEALEKERIIKSELLEALQGLMREYKQGADSGDWGNWKAEEQDEYIQAQQAIEKALK
jgi:hypothetical protein